MDAVSSWVAEQPRVRSRAFVTALRLVCALTLLALAVRLIGIGIRPLWLDEAYSAWFSSRSWHDLWFVVPTYETHPPFYYSLLKLWRSLFGGGAVALRLPSVILGAATVPVVMLAACELERLRPTGRRHMLMGVAGFLTACGPTLVQHGQEARPYAPMAFAYAVAILGLLKLLGDFRDLGPGRLKSWGLFVLGAELTLWSHALGAIYVACLALALLPAWLGNSSPQWLARGAIAAATTVLFYLPCLWLIAGRTGDWGTGWLTWKPEMLLTLLGLYGVPVEVLTVFSAAATLILFLLAKRAIVAGFSERGWNAERALLVLWWGPPLATALISALFIPLFLPRTLTATLVACYLAIASALARTGSRTERLVLSITLAGALLPATVAMALRPATEQWDEVDAYLQQKVHPGDVVWLYPNDSALPLRAAGPHSTYARRGIPADYPAIGIKGPIRAGSPAVVSLTPDGARRFAAEADARHVPTVWLVERQAAFTDPDGDVPHALERSRRAGRELRWRYITVQAFARR